MGRDGPAHWGAAVTIAAVCPHCETRFQLQPDLLGKTIRCPNSDCREPFEVVESSPLADVPTPSYADPPTTADAMAPRTVFESTIASPLATACTKDAPR